MVVSLASGQCLLGAAGFGAGLRGGRADTSGFTNALTLTEAISDSLQSNPGLRASGARVNAAKARAYQSKLWSNPELELQVEDWPVSNGNSFSDSKDTIGLAQTVPFPGKKKLDRQIGAFGARFAGEELNARRLAVVREVKTAFYQVLAAERSAEVARELVAVAESSAATARKRVTAGAAPDQEQLRAEILLEETRIELAGFEREWAVARQSLAAWIGRPDLGDAPLDGTLVEIPDLTLLERGPDRWLSAHPGVRSAQANRERTEFELRRARLEPYPDVRAGVSGGRVGETDQSIIQFGFSFPLPIIDRGKGKREEAQANLALAEAELAGVEQEILRAWGGASQRLRTAAAQVNSYRERILPKAIEALRLVQAGFDQGKFGFMDFLDTQRTAAEARLAYQQRLLELNIALAEIEALQVQYVPLATGSQPERSKLNH